jgi:hypothetical protein
MLDYFDRYISRGVPAGSDAIHDDCCQVLGYNFRCLHVIISKNEILIHDIQLHSSLSWT